MDQQHKYIEEIYHFQGSWEMPSHCGLMIRQTGDKTTVILTELYETNPGSSATSMIEPLALEILTKYSLAPDKVTFIVHNPERSSRYNFFAETFYEAKLHWDGNRFINEGWERLGGLNEMASQNR